LYLVAHVNFLLNEYDDDDDDDFSRCVRCFNCLPQAVVAAETVAEFKRKFIV